MKKNMVQFQRGEGLFSFLARYGTNEQCETVLFETRWPDEFCCPECGGHDHCYLRSKRLYQCNRCHHQTAVTARTIVESTKLPLKTWFLAMYLVTQSKDGISSLSLARHLGISQNSAWLLKHKLMQVMLERENQQPLAGRIELDDAYWGGKRRGGKRGRGAPGKHPFVAAVQTTEDGHPIRMKCSAVPGFRKDTIERWCRKLLAQGSHVVSDGFSPFDGIDKAGFSHEKIVTGGGAASVEILALQWINTMLGNIKNSLHGTYHAFRGKHLPRYLAEFNYRFNRRFELNRLVDRLLYVAVRTPPMPARLIELAEVAW